MSDNRQDLRDKARQTGCEVTIPQAVVPVIPTRPTVPCDPVSPDLLPNTFVTPDGSTPVPAGAPTLALISLGNDAQTKSCADVPGKEGTVPATYTIAADAVVLDFSWYDVTPALSEGQSIFISTLYNDLNALKALLTSTAPNAILALAAYAHITDQQAKSAHTLARDIKLSLNQQAGELAILQLICGWNNETQTISCPTGALSTAQGAALNLDALNPSIVPAGSVFSVDSLGDANTTAYAFAVSALSCIYGNEAQTVTCASLYPGDPVDSSPSESSVTKAANTYFSTESKAAANLAAIEAASQELNCFWLNDEITVTCDPDDADVPAITNGTLIYNSTTNQLTDEYENGQFPQGSVTAQSLGNTVIVEAGLFTSTISSTEAFEDATAAGEALLLCRWGNDVTKAQCPIVDIEDPNKKGLLDNSQNPPVPFKVKVLPNLELSQPPFAVTNFLRAKSTSTITAALGSRILNITPWDPAVALQFGTGDFVSIKPTTGINNDLLSGLNLVGEITAYTSSQMTVNVMQVSGSPLDVLGGNTWSQWSITLAQGISVIQNSVLSDVSKEDANLLAQSLIESSLRCVYCNVQVDPRCLPVQLQQNYDGTLVVYDPADIPLTSSATVWDLVPWTIVDDERQPTALNLVWQVDAYGVPLKDEYGFKIPVYQGNTVVDPGLIKDPQFSWSDDATLGVAAGKFCGEVVPVVQEIAENQLPVSFYREQADACVYCNDPVGADCVNGAVRLSEDPLNGSIFLPARTVCVSSAPNNYELNKYLIADSIKIDGTQNSQGLFSTSPSLSFTFSNSINLNDLGVSVGDILYISGTALNKFPITGVDSVNKKLNISNPSAANIPVGLTQVFVSKPLKATLNESGGVITATVTTPGFDLSDYSFVLNSDYLKLAGTANEFILNGQTAPNLFNILNLDGNTIPSGEQFIELWKKDTTNQTLAKQYATDVALDLAAALLACISITVNCSQQITVTCEQKGKPGPNLDPVGPVTVTLPRCFLTDTEATSAELTEQARQMALQNILHCRYYNNTVTVSCGGPASGDSRGKWLVNKPSTAKAKTFYDESFSLVTQSAGELAQAIANSGSCIWTNSTQNFTCDNIGLSITCPTPNRAFKNAQLTIPEGTLVQIVSDRNYLDPTSVPFLEDLNKKVKEDIAQKILKPICEFCGNTLQIKETTQGPCDQPKDLYVNFNQTVGQNSVFAETQSQANATAKLLSTGHEKCLKSNAPSCVEFSDFKASINTMLISVNENFTELDSRTTSLKATLEGLTITCESGSITLEIPDIEFPGSINSVNDVTASCA